MSDLIDRQAAIDDIWTVSPLAPLDREWIDRWLRQFPPANNSETPNSSDCISRQAAIETVMECYDNDELFEVYEDKLRELPPAQPERIKGHWIDAVIPNDSGGLPVIVCDKCNTFFPLQFGDSHNFCPNCGAEMEVTT